MNIEERLIQRNYTGGRQGQNVEFVVLHTYNGRGTYLDGWFNNPSAQVSSHYSVLKNGVAVRYVREGDTAWHAGNWDANLRSVGIEHQDDGNFADSARTPELYETSAQLIADIYRRYGWDKNDMGRIRIHKEFTSTGCPGGLDVGRIKNRVHGILNPPPPPVNDQLYRVFDGVKQLGAFGDRDNAFNLWYTGINLRVTYQNAEITNDFRNMANKLETQVTELKTQVTSLKEQKTDLEGKLSQLEAERDKILKSFWGQLYLLFNRNGQQTKGGVN